MMLHGTQYHTAWSGLCLLVTLVTSAVVAGVEAQRPPLPAWQHQCQCGGGEHRPPPGHLPPPARPSCEKYKDVSQREINDIGGRGRAALGYMLLCSASGARAQHGAGAGRGGGGGGRGDKHVGGGLHPYTWPLRAAAHGYTTQHYTTVARILRNIVYCLTLIQLKTKSTLRTYIFLFCNIFLHSLASKLRIRF